MNPIDETRYAFAFHGKPVNGLHRSTALRIRASELMALKSGMVFYLDLVVWMACKEHRRTRNLN